MDCSDARKAVKALIVANHFVETELEKLRAAVSTGYPRGNCLRRQRRCRVIGRIGTTKGSWQMMKQPTEDDFTVVEVLESGVTVLFEPTQSFYTFYRLADPNDIKRCGPVSPEPDGVRHAGPSGDTGDYRSDEVQGMAHSLASDAAKAK